jgi:hypothetical protein
MAAQARDRLALCMPAPLDHSRLAVDVSGVCSHSALRSLTLSGVRVSSVQVRNIPQLEVLRLFSSTVGPSSSSNSHLTVRSARGAGTSLAGAAVAPVGAPRLQELIIGQTCGMSSAALASAVVTRALTSLGVAGDGMEVAAVLCQASRLPGITSLRLSQVSPTGRKAFFEAWSEVRCGPFAASSWNIEGWRGVVATAAELEKGSVFTDCPLPAPRSDHDARHCLH